MKNLARFIKESLSEINPFYKKISDFKEGQELLLGFINDDGYAEPMKVIVKKKGDETVFVNADDERDIKDWKEFINSTDDSFREYKNPQVAVGKDKKQIKEICEFYNTIAEM